MTTYSEYQSREDTEYNAADLGADMEIIDYAYLAQDVQDDEEQ